MREREREKEREREREKEREIRIYQSILEAITTASMAAPTADHEILLSLLLLNVKEPKG